MVLFREDEQRIKEMERAEKRARQTPLVKWARRLFKIGLWVGGFVFVGLYLLGMLGGDHPALKKGVEDYLNRATGYEAEVGAFGGLHFFPQVRLIGGDIVLRDRDGNDAVTVEGIVFQAGFWGMTMARRHVSAFGVRGLEVREGGRLPRALKVESAMLAAGDEDEAPAFRAEGHYGDRPFEIRMEIDAVMRGDRVRYFRFADQGDFMLVLGDLHVQGRFETPARRTKKIIVESVALAGHEPLRVTVGTNMHWEHRSFDIDVTDAPGDVSYAHAALRTYGPEELDGILHFNPHDASGALAFLDILIVFTDMLHAEGEEKAVILQALKEALECMAPLAEDDLAFRAAGSLHDPVFVPIVPGDAEQALALAGCVPSVLAAVAE